MNTPLLSVCLITYNHKDYISEAIEGVLMQKTNFKIELIIADDCSTDGTIDIINKYRKENPALIRIIQQERNVGPARNWLDLMNSPNTETKYISYFEGDDYWTNPLKLQKQVDFMEANPEYGISAHTVQELNTFDLNKNRVIPNINIDTNYSLNDYILNNKTGTCSLVFKKEFIKYLPKNFIKIPFGDLALVLTILKHSNKKIMVFADVNAVYRIHSGGLHAKYRRNSKKLIKAYQQHLTFVDLIKKDLLFENKYQETLILKKTNTLVLLLKLAKDNKIWCLWFYFKINYYWNKVKLKIRKKII